MSATPVESLINGESLAEGNLIRTGPSRIVMVESVRTFREYGRSVVSVHGRTLDTACPADADPRWVLAHLTLDPGQAVSVVSAACPGCGESAVPRTDGFAWQGGWAVGLDPLRLQWSHEDGEPLCPVVNGAGYAPALPVLSDEAVA